MTCTSPPFVYARYDECNKLAPTRRTTSDGGCPGPNEGPGDHYPDSRGISHAVDISQSKPGNPFGCGPGPGGILDIHWYGDRLAELWVAGNPILRRVLKYMVSHDYATGSAKIFDPVVGNAYWRLMSGDTHLSHLHTSFLYTLEAENYTGPYFGLVGSIAPVPVIDEDDNMIVCQWKHSSVPGRIPYFTLDKINKTVIGHDGAAIWGDQPHPTNKNQRVWKIGVTPQTPHGIPIGVVTGFGPVTVNADGTGKLKAVLVATADDGTFLGDVT